MTITMTMTAHPIRSVVAAAVVCAAMLGGCNIVGPASYLAFGQPKTPALYELEDRSTLVFVDDRRNAIPQNATQLRRTIADRASIDLMTEKVLTETLSSADAMALARQHDRQGELLSIDEIGEATGAQQVIYVEMTSFRGSTDGMTPQPTASCRVKVIDVANRVRLFPPPESELDWQVVTVTSPAINPQQYRSSTGRREIERMLALLMGDQVAKVFYEHVPDEVGSRLNPN